MKNTDLRKLSREEFDPNSIYGIVLAESKELLLIAREYDFFLDGYQILRKEDITSSSTSKSLKYVYKILKAEGKLKSLHIPDLDICDWQAVFRSLGRNEFVIADDEKLGNMAIGPITRINKKSMSLRYFDGTGKWGEEEKLFYTNITSVQFKTNYITHHEKYIYP